MGMEAFSSWALRAFGLNLFCASPLVFHCSVFVLAQVLRVVWSALDLGVANPGSARAAGALGSFAQGVGRRTGAGAEHRHRWQQHMERGARHLAC